VIIRVPAHLTHAYADTVVHSQHAHLRYRILLEEFPHIFLCVLDGDDEPVAGPIVLVEHGFREVEDKDYVSYDAALEGLRVLP
jgi:hypothetical protein